MRSTHLAIGLLAALPLLQPPAAYWPPGDRPTARPYVGGATASTVTFSARAPGGRLWVAAPRPQFRDYVRTTTPAFIEVYGAPAGLSISATPEAALRLRLLMGRGSRKAATYAGWTFRFRLARDEYVLEKQTLPAPRG